MAYAKIRPRRGTKYEWSSYDPVLSEGELAIEFPDTGIGSGLCKFKVGDGVTHWNQLKYAFDGTAAAAIDGGGIVSGSLIQIRTATANAWYNTNPILIEKEIAYCSDPEINSIKIGDGISRWNQLPYIRASALIENPNSYDFGSEDEEPETENLNAMESYINYNNNYETSAFDNYTDNTIPTPDEEDDSGDDSDDDISGDNQDDADDEPGEEDNPDDTEGPEEEPLETAGLKDLLDSGEEEASEDT